MAKGKAAENFEEAAKLMQLDSPVIPADADPSAITPPAITKPAQAAPAPDPSAQPAAEANDQSTAPEQETAPAEEKISEEERKRRSFQAENEKIKQDLERFRLEQQALQRDIEVERAKSNALMNMLSGMSTLRGDQPEPKKAAKAKAEKEPELWDFIKADDYDRDEALDPRTPSGQAWSKYNRAIQRYESAQTFKQQQAEAQEVQAREITLKNAKDLADAYPEFKNVLTGQPDFDKINEWLDSLGKTDWVTLKKSLDKKPSVANGHATVVAPPSPEAEIARRASRPASVATQASNVETPSSKKFSPEVEGLHKLFGGSIALPADAS